MELDRRKLLTVAVGGMMLMGMLFVLYPFMVSFRPAAHAIEKWQVELNISILEPGELKQYEGFGQQPIWVYRRTPEQISWLKGYTSTIVAEFVIDNLHSENFGGKFRSLDPEYFIFTEWRHKGKTYLQQENAWVSCGTLQYHEGELEVRNGVIFKGAIACLEEHENPQYDYYTHIYDVAGMPAYEYTAPLQVPYYEINGKGSVIVGPKP